MCIRDRQYTVHVQIIISKEYFFLPLVYLKQLNEFDTRMRREKNIFFRISPHRKIIKSQKEYESLGSSREIKEDFNSLFILNSVKIIKL